MTNTDHIFPVDAVGGAPRYVGRDWRLFLSGFVTGNTQARPFGAISGIWPGSRVNVTATSSTWSVPAHGGVLDLETSTLAGPYLYKFETAQTGPMTPAHASLWRVDSLFVTMQDPAESDGTPAGTPADAFMRYVTGVPGAQGGNRGAAGGPPGVPDRSVEHTQITVPPAGQGNPTVKVVAPLTVANGGILPMTTSAYLPNNPYTGQAAYNAQSDRLLIQDSDGNWVPYSATHYCKITANPTAPTPLVKGTQHVYGGQAWDPENDGAQVKQIGTLITYDGNGGLVVHRDGEYMAGATATINNTSPQTEVETSFNVGATNYASGGDRRANNANHPRAVSISGPLELNKGDTVTLTQTALDNNTGGFPKVFYLKFVG